MDQGEYSEFIRACNGLTPQENSDQFSRARLWYGEPLDLMQAAREIGCPPDRLAAALAAGTKGRLLRMLMDNTPIPRATWERGSYQEAFLLLLEYQKRTKTR